MPQYVFLDESHAAKKKHGHPIYSVGGIIVEASDVATVERLWREAKAGLGLAGADLRHSWSYPGGSEQRLKLIETIPELPLKSAVVALLEDFRPKRMRLNKETRSDLYVHRDCFKYVLQRLCAPQYKPTSPGAHIVFFDDRDDFTKIDEVFRAAYAKKWDCHWGDTWPSLKNVGYAESLARVRAGALNEIADHVLAVATRWAASRCAEATGGRVPTERDELERACRAILKLFPTKQAIPKRWTGYSWIVWTQGLTGKEQLKAWLDRWLREVEARTRAAPAHAALPAQPRQAT